MKNLKNKIISCVLAGVTAFGVSTSFKKFAVDENNISVGKIEANNDLLNAENFIRPFIRDNSVSEVTKFGNRDYEKLDQYIITSLNNYYNRLMNATETERDGMLNTYRHLYSMWQELHNFKISKNLVEIDKMYDLFSYELYILGYLNQKK